MLTIFESHVVIRHYMKYVKQTHVKLVQFYEKKWEEAGLSLIHTICYNFYQYLHTEINRPD